MMRQLSTVLILIITMFCSHDAYSIVRGETLSHLKKGRKHTQNAIKQNIFVMDRDCVLNPDIKGPRRLVFVFEGYNAYRMRDAYMLKTKGILPPNPKGTLHSRLLYHVVGEVVHNLKDTDWFYFSQDYNRGVKKAFLCARKLAKKSWPMGEDKKPHYSTIIAIGYSYGGDSVFEFAELLSRIDIKVDLIISMDAIEKLHFPVIYPKYHNFKKGKNVEDLVYYYQRDDKISGIIFPLYGKKDNDGGRLKKFTINNWNAHLMLPSDPKVKQALVDDIMAVDPYRESYLVTSDTE